MFKAPDHVSNRSQTLRVHQNQNIPKGEMASQEPAVTFVSELQLIFDFMDDYDLLDNDEDFEKELAAISLEVSFAIIYFLDRILGATYRPHGTLKQIF